MCLGPTTQKQTFLVTLGLMKYRRSHLFFFFFFFAVRRRLTVVASPVVEHRLRMRRLSGHGSRAQPLRGMWDLPGPGHEPVSPASAGGLSTTAPPGKPQKKPSFKSNTEYQVLWTVVWPAGCKDYGILDVYLRWLPRLP